jgi:hypothetical protein
MHRRRMTLTVSLNRAFDSMHAGAAGDVAVPVLAAGCCLAGLLGGHRCRRGAQVAAEAGNCVERSGIRAALATMASMRASTAVPGSGS